MRPGLAEPDFDHPVGHRDDVVDGAERVLQRIAATGRDQLAEHPRDLVGGNLAPVRPSPVGKPENVAEAVVADVPGLAEPGHDLTARVELNESLRGIVDQHLIGLRQRPACRIRKLRLVADNDDMDHALGLAVAAARGDGQGHGQAQRGHPVDCVEAHGKMQ